MSQDRRIGATGLFILAMALYIWGLSPTIAWRDAPQFITVAHTLDISHPAGSPTYSLLAKPTTWLPIGNIAARINLFSALAAASAIVLLYMLLYDALVFSLRWVRQISALSGGVALLFSESFWIMAEIAEVYTLQNVFLLIMLSLLIHGRAQSHPLRIRYYLLFSFLYGLSAGVHATVVLCAPAFLGFIALTEREFFHSKALGFLLFFFLLGFSVFLYLPIRSLAPLAYDWGNPETLHQLLLHLTDHKDAPLHSAFLWQRLPYQLSMYGRFLVNEFSTMGCVLGCVGVIYLIRQDRPLAFMSAVIFLGNVGFFSHMGWTSAWGFIPSYVVISLWIGLGLYQTLDWICTLYEQRYIRLPRAVVYSAMGVSLISSFGLAAARHFPVANQANNYSAELYGQHLLEQLPPDSLLFCDYSWFPLLYLQQVEQRRPDLTFILQGELFFPEYFPPVSSGRFPNLTHIPNLELVKASTFDYFWELSTLNQDIHPLFLDPEGQLHKALSGDLIPQGLLFAFRPGAKVELTEQMLSGHANQLIRTINSILQGPYDDEATALLINKINYIADHFRHLQQPKEAENMYHAALRLEPESANVHYNYGTLLRQMDQPKEALEHLYQAYLLNPAQPKFNQQLGELLLSLGGNNEAVVFLERALTYGGKDYDIYAQLGLAYRRLGRIADARENFQLTVTHLEELKHRSPGLDGLQENMAWVESNLQAIKYLEHDRDTP